MQITLKLYTEVSVHNANAYEVLTDIQNYFTFDNHICSDLEQIWFLFVHKLLFFKCCILICIKDMYNT